MKLSADNLCYQIGNRKILDRISLSLSTGKTHVLLGPNGAGKSTLLRIMSGVLEPTEGDALMDGQRVNEIAISSRAKKLGVLTQRNTLDFPFTAGEVVAMGRTPHGSAADDAKIQQAVLAFLSINGDQVYTSLSGGERQLVQLARVFAQVWEGGEDTFLMLDEPMTALDLRHQSLVVAALKNFSALGTGQLIVMHDINLAAEVADEIVLMSEGKMLASGEPLEVLTASNLQATFDTPMVQIGEGRDRFFKTRPG